MVRSHLAGAVGGRGCGAGQDLRVDREGRSSGVLRAADSQDTEVRLPPPNVIDTAAPQAQPAPQQEGSTGYSQLAIVFPADQGTLHTNTGAFDLKVALQPALNAGDSFVVTLDGTPLAGRYTSGDIAVSEQDFQSAASDNVQHQLQVAVIDPGGNVLIAAAPVSFYVHRATVRQQAR